MSVPSPFLEEEGFNMMMKQGMSEGQNISRNTCKVDLVKVYEIEKKKLKKNLEDLNKISLTSDCWK